MTTETPEKTDGTEPEEVKGEVVRNGEIVKSDELEPLIEISAFAPDRPTARISSEEHPEGYNYELRLMREFGIADQQRLSQDGKEFERLWNKSGLTHKEGQRLKTVLDRMFDMVLMAPQSVKDQLDDQSRSNVVQAFTYAPFVIAAARTNNESQTESTSES